MLLIAVAATFRVHINADSEPCGYRPIPSLVANGVHRVFTPLSNGNCTGLWLEIDK